jgi:hypothetical protein
MKKQLLLITGLLLTTVLFCDIGGNQSQYRQIICTNMNITNAQVGDTCKIDWYYELVNEFYKDRDFSKEIPLYFYIQIDIIQHTGDDPVIFSDTIIKWIELEEFLKQQKDSIFFISQAECVHTIRLGIQFYSSKSNDGITKMESWLTHIIVDSKGVKVRDSDIADVNVNRRSKLQ